LFQDTASPDQPAIPAIPETRSNPEFSESEFAALKNGIEEAMVQSRLFENPTLTVSDLSARLKSNPKRVSYVINTAFGQNFNEYVNSHRVEAFLQRARRGEYKSQTLMGLAYDCGFNSKSTFLRAFRRKTGISPSDFIKNLENEVSNPDLGRSDSPQS